VHHQAQESVLTAQPGEVVLSSAAWQTAQSANLTSAWSHHPVTVSAGKDNRGMIVVDKLNNPSSAAISSSNHASVDFSNMYAKTLLFVSSSNFLSLRRVGTLASFPVNVFCFSSALIPSWLSTYRWPSRTQ
jgi:hypothetical protein